MSEKQVYRRDECLLYNGKYYCPGTVFEIDENWIVSNKKDALYSFADWERKDDKSVAVFVKTTKWKYVRRISSDYEYYIFQRVVAPYVAKHDVYYCWSKPYEHRYNLDDKMQCDGTEDFIEKLLRRKTVHGRELNGKVGILVKNINDAVVNVLEPIEWNEIDHPLKNGSEIKSVAVGWIVYIVLMIFGTIFNDRFGIWASISLGWWFFRQMIIYDKSGY